MENGSGRAVTTSERRAWGRGYDYFDSVEMPLSEADDTGRERTSRGVPRGVGWE